MSGEDKQVTPGGPSGHTNRFSQFAAVASRLRALLPTRPGIRFAALVAAVAVLVGVVVWAVQSARPGANAAQVTRVDQMVDMPGARIDTSYFTVGDGGAKRPAVLLAHGFGGSKDDLTPQAERLARDGYAVLTWSARGFGHSTGKIGLNDPANEVADVSRLIDWLAQRPEVLLDESGDPRVGIAGASYGGAVSYLAAAYDDRVDAIAPRISYWNLAEALFPNDVYKKLWSGVFFAAGGGCESFEPRICAMYQRVAEDGSPDSAACELLEARSPAAVGDRIAVPTYIVQGQSDSLFPLSQADAAARQIRANGAPVHVDWISGGHDGGDRETGRVDDRTKSWFDRYLKRDISIDTGPAFRVTRTGGIDSTNREATLNGAEADRYPGLRGTDLRSFTLTSGEQRFTNPPGATPPAVSALPGAGDLGRLSALGVGTNIDFPGQFAGFDSPPLTEPLRVTGSSEVSIRITSSRPDAVVFAKLVDVGPDGRTVLPRQLVGPQRISRAGPESGGTVATLRLPAVDHEFAAGHRLRLILSSTDLGFASPLEAAEYRAEPVSALTVPTDMTLRTATTPLSTRVWALPLAGAIIAALLLFTGRRRAAGRAPDPDLAEVPLQVTGLSKKYPGSDRYSVRDVSFRVEPGQVLGLLGPNGAGKTTTLRMLMGLTTPDAGEIRVFGHLITPGAPILSRVGSFVEGAGFLPHLSGHTNLELYWQATGRPAEDARIDEALRIADLGDAVLRPVRTYSQGMRQRLAIAQAMLGLPDLLILDEPTNGLDPQQIREMREVMIRYAAEGRTVIVSSHLLSEVEQSSSHLVVMDRGRLLHAGPVTDMTGSDDTIRVGVSAPLPEDTKQKILVLEGVADAQFTEFGAIIRLDGATPEQLIAELLRLEVPVNSFGLHRRLEDAFLNLISEGGTPA